jgi:hypothetical protein
MVVKYSNFLVRSERPLMSAVSFVVLIWFARCTFAENVMNLMQVALMIWILRLERGLSTSTVPAAGLHPPPPANLVLDPLA